MSSPDPRHNWLLAEFESPLQAAYFGQGFRRAWVAAEAAIEALDAAGLVALTARTINRGVWRVGYAHMRMRARQELLGDGEDPKHKAQLETLLLELHNPAAVVYREEIDLRAWYLVCEIVDHQEDLDAWEAQLRPPLASAPRG